MHPTPKVSKERGIIAAGNKGWLEKWFYYIYLVEMNPAKRAALIIAASKNGIQLKQDTIDILEKAKVSHHVRPLINLDTNGKWDASLVALRTERICSILWDRIAPWLEIS